MHSRCHFKGLFDKVEPVFPPGSVHFGRIRWVTIGIPRVHRGDRTYRKAVELVDTTIDRATHCPPDRIEKKYLVSRLRFAGRCCILNHMVHYQQTALDASFSALSDVTRRGILERLGRADASITELAGTFRMTLTGMKKHIGVLERTGLVTTEKAGRVRTCKLGPRRLEEAAAWIERYRQLWHARFDELDKIVEELQRSEKVLPPQRRK